MKDELDIRFWRRVDIREENECWEWQGSLTSQGYGRVYISNNIWMTAHRFSYFLQHGSLDPKLQINHHCDNPKCVNPRHLYQGTAGDNMADLVNRHYNEIYKIKFSQEDIKIMRQLRELGCTYQRIANLFNTSKQYIHQLLNNVLVTEND